VSSTAAQRVGRRSAPVVSSHSAQAELDSVTDWMPLARSPVAYTKPTLPTRAVTTPPASAASSTPFRQDDFERGLPQQGQSKGPLPVPSWPPRAGGGREAPTALLLWLGGFARRALIARPRAQEGPASRPTQSLWPPTPRLHRIFAVCPLTGHTVSTRPACSGLKCID